MNIRILTSILFDIFQSLHVRCTLMFSYDKASTIVVWVLLKQLSSSPVLGFSKLKSTCLILCSHGESTSLAWLHNYFLVVAVFHLSHHTKHFQERKKISLTNIHHNPILVTVAKSNFIFVQESQRKTILFNATYKTIVKLQSVSLHIQL